MLDNSRIKASIEICATKSIHRDVIHTLQNKLPGSDVLSDLADFLKFFRFIAHESVFGH